MCIRDRRAPRREWGAAAAEASGGGGGGGGGFDESASRRKTWRERASEYVLAGGGSGGAGGRRRGPHERGLMRDGQVGHAGQANRAVLGPDAMFPASAPTGPYSELRNSGPSAAWGDDA